MKKNSSHTIHYPLIYRSKNERDKEILPSFKEIFEVFFIFIHFIEHRRGWGD